jgi:hypothetical protein
MGTQAPQLPSYKSPGDMPPFISANPAQIEQQAVSMDQAAYGLSDADFRQRYPSLYSSQQTFLNNLQTQMQGGINPQLQNLWTRSGMQNALGATGLWSQGAGTPGMANVARNLGIDYMGYQNQILNQFQMANDTFRPRTYGLTGADTAQLALANLAGQNNWNASNYAYKVQQAQFAAGLGAQQAALSANAANASTGTMVGGITSGISTIASIAGMAGFACWLARSAYGMGDPRWKRFRLWLLHLGPPTLRRFYLWHGQALARSLENHPKFKRATRLVMDCLCRRIVIFPLCD